MATNSYCTKPNGDVQLGTQSEISLAQHLIQLIAPDGGTYTPTWPGLLEYLQAMQPKFRERRPACQFLLMAASLELQADLSDLEVGQ